MANQYKRYLADVAEHGEKWVEKNNLLFPKNKNE